MKKEIHYSSVGLSLVLSSLCIGKKTFGLEVYGVLIHLNFGGGGVAKVKLCRHEYVSAVIRRG